MGSKELSERSEVSLSNSILISVKADERLVMENEVLNAMRLLGLTKIEEINPSMVECLQEIWK
jgi:hypothetical protein